MDTLQSLVKLHPELAIFATMVLGHAIGRLEFRGFGFGSVVGTLIAGMGIGVLTRPEIPDLLKWAFFDLFLFAVGYGAGPQFFASLKRETLPQMLLAVVVSCSGLAAALGMVYLFRFDPGLSAGLVSGSLTQSAALGSALNTLQSMEVPEATRAVLMAHAPLADAICYVFGEVGLILFLTVVAPRLMKIDLPAVAREAEERLRSSGVPDADTFLAYTPLTYRAYRIDNPALAGLSVEAFEHQFAVGRLMVESYRRAGQIHRRPELDALLQLGDIVAVVSRRPGIVAAAAMVGAEIDDAELLSVPLQEASIILTRGEMAGRTLAELSDSSARGIYLLAITRGQQALPREPGTVVQRGDVFRLTGSPDAIARAAKRLGYIEPDPARTDLVYLAGGIVVGTLVGLLQLHVAGVPLGLGGSGGVLVVGLVAGWVHSRYPVFGRIPESAQRLLSDVGLIVFISAIGLAAGPHALEAIDQGGIELFARLIGAGVVVTMAGPIIGVLFGRFVLKMPPVSLLPGIAGAQTTVATLNALKERSGSDVFSLGFTVPFAVSNVLITMWGPVIVAFAFGLQR
ncbi:TrkA C-terminal domain-containing protein [Niveibacterium sp. SC-1]|uniref:aspartate:alanine exchanger family transporter n=1 Tax=Niveibacterium sp. SC-1 TaxID=3135646 RepID=UPI00311F8F91